MSSHQQPRSSAQPIADPTALRALDARHVRSYSFHFVLLGLSAVVLAFLLAVSPLTIALAVGAVVVLACIAALVRFIQAHRNVPARFAPLAAGFWGVWTVGVVLAVLGASVWQHNAAAIWGGGLLALAAGLVVGHLVNHSADATRAPGAGLH